MTLASLKLHFWKSLISFWGTLMLSPCGFLFASVDEFV